jgi:hypothetical protein
MWRRVLFGSSHLQIEREGGQGGEGVAGIGENVPSLLNGNGLCVLCKMVRPGFELLWQCFGCGDAFFHEMCMGYADGAVGHDMVLPNGVELETEVFCPNCVIKKNLTDDVIKAIAEVKVVGEFLKDARCEFVLEKIEQDGYCCFCILEKCHSKFAGMERKEG